MASELPTTTNTTAYCVTWFAPDQPIRLMPKLEKILHAMYKIKNVKYVVGQWEKAPSTDRLHIQAYMQFSSTVRFNSLRAKMPPGCHLELSRGTPLENFQYCTKEETRVEGTEPVQFGARSVGQGKRTDLLDLMARVEAGATMNQIRLEYPKEFLQYSNHVEHAMRIKGEANRSYLRTLSVHVFWGPNGTGKSAKAWAAACAVTTPEDVYVWCASNNSFGFPGYKGEKVIILEDLNGTDRHIRAEFMQRILDRYPLQVNCFGRIMQAAWEYVYCTSNVDPVTWYGNAHPEIYASIQERMPISQREHLEIRVVAEGERNIGGPNPVVGRLEGTTSSMEEILNLMSDSEESGSESTYEEY